MDRNEVSNIKNERLEREAAETVSSLRKETATMITRLFRPLWFLWSIFMSRFNKTAKLLRQLFQMQSFCYGVRMFASAIVFVILGLYLVIWGPFTLHSLKTRPLFLFKGDSWADFAAKYQCISCCIGQQYAYIADGWGISRQEFSTTEARRSRLSPLLHCLWTFSIQCLPGPLYCLQGSPLPRKARL